MQNPEDVISDLRFWSVMFAEMFGQVGDAPDPSIVYPLFNVNERDAQEWFNEFVMPEFCTEDSLAIPISLGNGVDLSVSFQDGVYWYLGTVDHSDALLANVGGHWLLPGLRWDEVMAISAAAPDAQWLARLLLLPITWLTEDDNATEAQRAVESTWVASGLVPKESAAVLADVWANAASCGPEYGWRMSANGWVCNAHWSTRGQQRNADDITRLNQLIGAAIAPHKTDSEFGGGE